MAKASIGYHTENKTEAPEHVVAVWQDLQRLKHDQQAAAVLEAEKRRAEREQQREEDFDKTKDHWAVGAQYNNDNDEAVVKHAVSFLSHPQMAQFPQLSTP